MHPIILFAAFLLLPISQQLHQVQAVPGEQQQVQIQKIPALRMTRRPDQMAPLRNEYFDQTTYTTRDFPRLIEGLSQQISRDLVKAHTELVEHGKLVKHLQNRVDMLEEMLSKKTSATPRDVDMSNEFLAVLGILLLVLFVALLIGVVLLIKCCLRSSNHSSATHVRLAEPESI